MVTVPNRGGNRRVSPRLHLLGQFALQLDGVRVDVPPAGQRVLALLALFGGSAHRSRLGGTLWPDQTEARALSNLRAAVWRLPAHARSLVARRGGTLLLDPTMTFDLAEASAAIRCVLGEQPPHDTRTTIDRDLFMLDLLTAMDEEWVVVPRERHRQRRLHALEALAADDLRHGRALDAVDTALAAVAAEPLRESAQQLVLRAHLAAGNRAAALAHFERFRSLLATELGVAPSQRLTQLLAEAVNRQVTTR